MSHGFPANATSGVITGLKSGATYQFQVLATAKVNGSELVGDKSPVTDETRVRVGGEICVLWSLVHMQYSLADVLHFTGDKCGDGSSVSGGMLLV